MPESFSPLSVFLDSNVLFSASRSLESRLRDLWRMHGVTPLTSIFSVDEVRRNIRTDEHHLLLEAMLRKTAMVSDGPIHFVPKDIKLAAKDMPILATAIFASADYLVTGDGNHFGHLYGTTVSHVKILSPAEFLARYEYRLQE